MEKQCGGESVSQSPLKDKVFSIFLGQNPPIEPRPKMGFRLPTKAGSANGPSSTKMPLV
jgi:hypothetical protein